MVLLFLPQTVEILDTEIINVTEFLVENSFIEVSFFGMAG